MRGMTLVSCAVATAFASVASAQVMTFGDLPGAETNPIPNTYSENGLNLSATSGVFHQTFFAGNGNPAPAIYAHTQSSTSSTFEVTHDGGVWNFVGVDLLNINAGATFSIEGLLGGASQFTDSGPINNFPVWQQYGQGNSGFDIDTLRVTVNLGDSLQVFVDNVNAVPAPGVLPLLAGAGLFAARRRR